MEMDQCPIEHIDRGAVAGAVRVEQAEYLAFLHIEIKVRERDAVTESFGQTAHFDCRVHLHDPSPSPWWTAAYGGSG
jgi:hypothetical protein